MDASRSSTTLFAAILVLSAGGCGNRPPPTDEGTPLGESSATPEDPAGSPAAKTPDASPDGPSDGTSQPDPDGPAAAPSAPAIRCDKAPAFRHERIVMPPGFAPDMPAGEEHLLFSPDMFEPGADGYFSYVFTMAFTDPAPAGKKKLSDLLRTYFRGLVEAVGKTKKKDYDLTQVKARLVPVRDDYYFGTVDMFDAFTNGQKLQLKLKVWSSGKCLRAAASPQPLDAPVWAELEAALSCLPCPS